MTLYSSSPRFTFADLFAGIGGFHIALSRLGGSCIFAAENDANARRTYEHNFRGTSPSLFTSDQFAGDITCLDEHTIPDFDVLCAGFPCQPFSQQGHRRGFADTRGTLFFDVARIIEAKKPKAFILENVRHLLHHDGGRTFSTVERILSDTLGYSFHYTVFKASDFGLPQHRPRLFMVGFREAIAFQFPAPVPLRTTMSDILGGRCPKEVGYTLRVGGRGSGIRDRRNWDAYLVEGEEARLTPEQAKRMQGFPSSYTFPVSDNQSMKQLGNAVAVPVAQAVAQSVLSSLFMD